MAVWLSSAGKTMPRPQKVNRPMIGKSRTRRYNVSLPPEIAEAIRKLGGGNLSEGIRRALAKSKEAG